MKKMTRRESIWAMASALAATGAAAKAASQENSGGGQAQPGASGSQTGAKPATEAQAAQPSQADQSFQGFVDRYFDGFFQFDPAQATSAGIHKYDAELPAYSNTDIQAEIRRNQHALWELRKIPDDALSADNQFDARLLESLIRGHLLDLTGIRAWAKDPNFYNDVSSAALFTLVERDFASLDDRLKSLVARAKRIPEVLNSARTNVANPPGIYTQVAIGQAQAEIDFLQNALPQAVAGARSGSLKAEFNIVNQQVLTAYAQFLDYLKNSLAAQSHGEFAIGAENFRKMLLYDEMVDTPIRRLLAIGESELRRTQSQFIQTAKILDATKSPLEVFRSLSLETLDANQILKNTQSVLDSLRQFVLTHEIVTVPPAPIPQVKQTPAFMAALTFASMDAPGPLEKNSIQSYYYVTLPGADWSSAQQQQLLQFFNPYALRIISIHEVYPGHYVQSLWLKRLASKARKLEPSLKVVGTNCEGWAHYCEGMMPDAHAEHDTR